MTRLYGFSKRLLIITLLLLPLILFNPLFMQIRPAHASPSLGTWESFASAHSDVTDGTLVDGPKAYDRKDYYPVHDTWNYTYGEFEIKDGRWFEVSGWDYSGGVIDHVNFTAVWEVYGITTGSNPDEYRFVYFVDPSATEGELQTWQNFDQTKTLTKWKQPTDPDGGSWTETKINSIRFRADTQHHGGHDGAIIRIWELYLTVGYTPLTVSIQPASTVTPTIAPKNPEVLRPDGNGFATQWTGDYTDWNETTQNGDTDYVSTTESGRVQASTFGDSSETWNIAGVRLVIWARLTATDADPEEIIPLLRVGTSLNWGPNIALTTTYAEYTTEWAVNPTTGNNWAWSDIDALQAGVRSMVAGSWTGEMRVTQIYLEVVGERYQVTVNVDYVVNLWGWQVELTYDPSILHGVNWEGDEPVYVDPFLASAGGVISKLALGPGFNNTEGKLAMTAAFLTTVDPAKLVDGSGNIASVAFTVVGVGPTDIILGGDTAILEGLHGEFLTAELVDGSFDNTGAPPIPEFPLGAVAEIALGAIVIYFWWRTKSNHKSPKVTASHKAR